MDSLKYIKQKYNDIIPRSFKTKLEIFLFERCITIGNLKNITVQDFKHFKIEQDLVAKYQRAWQLEDDQSLEEGGLRMKEIDKNIEKWNKENAELKKDLFKNYKIYFETSYFPFSEFEKLYSRDPKQRVCQYCKINDEHIAELANTGQIFTKRDRGFLMEIDRIRPNYEYTPDNVVLACYWCNNAKTDEFSEGEFINHIGPGIEKVWEERTNNPSDNLP